MMTGTTAIPEEDVWKPPAGLDSQQAAERPSDDTIGPFATIEEAEDSPATLVTYAQAWLDSEAFEPYRAAAEEDASTDL